MEKKILAIAEVTEKVKKEWTEKYGEGNMSKITVSGKVCFLRPPTRPEMGAYSVTYRTNPVKANESLLKTTMLAGDPEILEDDKLFYAAAAKLPELIEAADAELEKF
jgi:hypothetical protein